MPTREIAGVTVEVTPDGYLLNLDQWTEDMAPVLAQEEGIAHLTDGHWKVIRFLQSDFKESGAIPTIRRVKNAGGIPTKDLYALFPKGPLKKATRIAGLMKPSSCV